jgi:ubiquinone/menaquinone biosynthesis C-methylase UbiE
MSAVTIQTPELREVSAGPSLDERICAGLEAYYTPLYRDALGLPDWPAHVAKRMREDENFRAILEQAERRVIGRRIGPPCRVLVVGGGTGADFGGFAQRGCETHAVEPNPAAVEIARLKARRLGIDGGRFIEGVAERLPYPDGHFDFIWSWTVIEHVQDVGASLREMVRVLRPGGEMFIGTVDYRGCYEPHYKLYLPCFLPAWVVRLVLRWRGRDPGFYGTLARTNAGEIARILQGAGVIGLHAVYPEPPPRGSPGRWAAAWLERKLGISSVQHWLVRKA